MASTTAVDMGRVRTQLDRRALSCFHQRCIFDHKIYSRKRENKYLLWFVAQTRVLHNAIAERVDAYPLSSGYLDEAVVSRCFVPRTTKAAYICTPHIKTLGKISRQKEHESDVFQYHHHSSDVFQPVVPSSLVFVLFFVWTEDKTMQNKMSPVGN